MATKASCWDGTWAHGRVWRDAKGLKVYVIRKRIGGRLFEKSTARNTEEAAKGEYKRFELDPDHYTPSTGGEDALYMDETLIAEYLKFSAGRPKDAGKGNSQEWVKKQRTYLAWWAGELAGKNLKKLDLRQDVIVPLKDTTARAHRIAIIKAFYAWLRTVEHLVKKHEDPVWGELKAVKVPSAQVAGTKTPPTVKSVKHVLDFLVFPWTDALMVAAGTGWHTTEVCRFADGGMVALLDEEYRVGDAWGVLGTPHKNKEFHKSRVTRQVYEAGERLRAHGSIDRTNFDKAVKKACTDAGLGSYFTPANMRHLSIIFGVEKSGDKGKVATYHGHKGQDMADLVYAPNAAPAKVPTAF